MTLFRNSGVDWLNRLHGTPAIASVPLPEFKNFANRSEIWMGNR